jgi:pilus assembly protein CpaE
MTETPPIKNASNWKTLLICPDTKMSAQFLNLISHQVAVGPILELPSYPYRSLLAETLAGKAPQICFLDAASDSERALATIRTLIEVQPSIQIVVLLSGNDPDMILRCLRQGATEFMVEPFGVDQLRPALDKLARLRRGGSETQQGQGRVICVMPAKGACGATTIAAHLAPLWKRSGAKKVLLADLDQLTGTLSFVLKIKSSYSYMEVLRRAATLDEDVWKALVFNHNGVDVLLSPDDVADGMQEETDPSPIIEFSRTLYDTVILDSGGPYGEWGLGLAQLSDEILLVTTNELPTLQSTQRAISYLERHQVPRSKIKLVVNRYNREVGLSKEVIETALHMDVFHVIPSDYEAIQKSLIEGKYASPNTDFSKGVTGLAELLSGKSVAAAKPVKQSGLSSLFSMFSKKPATSR